MNRCVRANAEESAARHRREKIFGGTIGVAERAGAFKQRHAAVAARKSAEKRHHRWLGVPEPVSDDVAIVPIPME